MGDKIVEKLKIAVLGVGATGSVLAAALLSKYPDTVLIGRKPELGNTLREKGINITGAITCQARVKYYFDHIAALKDFPPALIFLATKTFHLPLVLEELKTVLKHGTKIVATQNGLGVEDLVAEVFGVDAVFRMSLNFGVSLKCPGIVKAAFFNRPNHFGGLSQENRQLGLQIAEILSDCGLDTEFVDDIKLFVWRKMILKCTMASICAVTNKTIKEALEFPPTREIAEACIKEAIAVADAMGYEPGEDYLKEAVGYLQKAGVHKDSMCFDIENKTPTEIDFLGGKIVDYARQKGIATPFYVTMTNLVKAIEDNYLER
jgi:2-dehydropantoate 2-reductase